MVLNKAYLYSLCISDYKKPHTAVSSDTEMAFAAVTLPVFIQQVPPSNDVQE